MSLNLGWTFAAFTMAMLVSAGSASATCPAGPPPAPVPNSCGTQLNDCLGYANQYDDEYLRNQRTMTCYDVYNTCMYQNPVCGDGTCSAGENCSSCFSDCAQCSSTNLGTVTRNCSSTLLYTDISFWLGQASGGYCYYPIYGYYTETCNVYRRTETYNTCSSPPSSIEETYEGNSTRNYQSIVGTHAEYGPCRG